MTEYHYTKTYRVNCPARDQPPELDVSEYWSMIDEISMMATLST